MSHTHDDPELTAYALGEAVGEARAQLEAQAASCAECRQEIEAARGLAARLRGELEAEAVPGLGAARKAAIERRLARPRRQWLKAAALAASLLVAAGVALSLTVPNLLEAQKSGAPSPATTNCLRQRLRGLSPEPAPRGAPAMREVELQWLHAQSTASCPKERSTAGGLPVKWKTCVYFGVGNGEKDGLFAAVHGDPAHNTEAYDRIVDNPFRRAVDEPLSTFSIDVDTASYANVRRFLASGNRPPKDAVRIEELVNYFPYDYPAPAAGEPFSVNVEVAACPWKEGRRLVRVGLKGREIDLKSRPASNLVFLLDVSGSMQPENKLPLVKQAMRLLVEQLDERDRVAIAVYAGSSGLVLPSTCASDRGAILGALDRLEAGGSTNGGEGIRLAYDTAAAHLARGGTNRVILCTDGDFNVGVTSQGDLTRLIEEHAKRGVFLSVLGFGMGNVKDSTMEKLADKGNGNYAYIDTLKEARKVLVEQMAGTLLTIAKGVKIQVEFNPARVQAYRLVGYENRMLAKEDFNDDRKDAGEIGSGHTVTALYEVVPPGEEVALPPVDPLKYQAKPQAAPPASDDLLTVKLRWKEPEGDTSALKEVPVLDRGLTLGMASADFKFAAAVAVFGMVLRDSEHKGGATLDTALELGSEGRGSDRGGYRGEFLALVRKAKEVAK